MNQQNLLFIKVDENMFKSTEKIDCFNLVSVVQNYADLMCGSVTRVAYEMAEIYDLMC